MKHTRNFKEYSSNALQHYQKELECMCYSTTSYVAKFSPKTVITPHKTYKFDDIHKVLILQGDEHNDDMYFVDSSPKIPVFQCNDLCNLLFFSLHQIHSQMATYFGMLASSFKPCCTHMKHDRKISIDSYNVNSVT